MTRKSKIARLPRSVRDELNQRLDNGEPGLRLVEWLNSLPEAKEALARDFEGHRITAQNLSEWKRGGYHDWVAQQECRAGLQDWLADAKELGEVASPEKLGEAMMTFVTVHYAAAMYDSDYRPESREKLRLLSPILNDVIRLRNSDLARERLELDEQRMELNRQRLDLDRARLELARQKVTAELEEVPNRNANKVTGQEARSHTSAGATSPSPLRSGDLSRLGSGEWNVGEATGPRGPSERERASQQGRGEEALRANGETSLDNGCSDSRTVETGPKTPLQINALQPNPIKSNNPFFIFLQTAIPLTRTVGQASRLSPSSQTPGSRKDSIALLA